MRGLSSVLVVLCFSLLCGCTRRDITIFSSRASNDGVRVALSAMIYDGPNAEGLLILKSANSTQEILLGETAPDLFMRWLDDQTLELWSAQKPLDIDGSHLLGGVNIVPKSYDPPQQIEAAHTQAELGSKAFTISAEDVAANFTQLNENAGYHCILTLRTNAKADHEASLVEIDASIFPIPNANATGAGISTRFT